MKIRLEPSRREVVVGMSALAVVGCGDKDGGGGEGGTTTDDTGGGSATDDTGTSSVSMVIGEAHLGWAADGREFEVYPQQHVIVGRDADGNELWRIDGIADELISEGVNFPWEVHVHDGLVYVLFRGDHFIGVLDEDGIPVSAIGDHGDGEGELHHPVDFAIGDDGRVYVSDSTNHRIMVFETDGTYVTHFGEEGVDEDHHLNGPRGMAFDADGMLHIADRGNRRIHVYDTEGTWQRSYGGDDLVAPESLAIAPDGTVYVADHHDTVLHVFDADGTVGEPISIEVDGWPAHPVHLEWNLDGALYVRVSAIHHDDVESDNEEAE